jgi:L-arabinose 1- dehydrogenase
MLRLGIVGLGLVARFYAAALNRIANAELANTKLAAVCDIDSTRIERFRAEGVDEYADYQQLLGAPQIDGVIIATPNYQHLPIARAALNVAKHVCCEKPLASCLADAQELASYSAAKQLTLFTAFHRRYNKNFLRFRSQLLDRSQIASVEANYLEAVQEHAGRDNWYLDPSQTGGGCIADNGPNVFDMLRVFLGPLEVERAEVIRNNSVDICAHVSLSSADGIPIDVRLDWAYQFGEKKDLKVVLRDGKTLLVDLLEGYTDFKQSLWHEYEGVLLDFVDEVNRGQCSAVAGCDAVRLVEAAYRKAVEIKPRSTAR